MVTRQQTEVREVKRSARRTVRRPGSNLPPHCGVTGTCKLLTRLLPSLPLLALPVTLLTLPRVSKVLLGIRSCFLSRRFQKGPSLLFKAVPLPSFSSPIHTPFLTIFLLTRDM